MQTERRLSARALRVRACAGQPAGPLRGSRLSSLDRPGRLRHTAAFRSATPTTPQMEGGCSGLQSLEVALNVQALALARLRGW